MGTLSQIMKDETSGKSCSRMGGTGWKAWSSKQLTQLSVA